MAEKVDSPSPVPMGYAQWVSMTLCNLSDQDIKVKNVVISEGKLYADGNKDIEVPPSKYEDYIIPKGEKVLINACGDANSPSGTAGRYDVVDPVEGDNLIRNFYWDCPWGSSTMTWTVGGSNPKWVVEAQGNNLDLGTLGPITIKFATKPEF